MTFKPMYDLESLTEPQRQEYYLKACEFFGVSPDLNLLAFMYMDSGEGKRNLVLYAKKGATDQIRANQKISVTSTTRADGPGYVAWIVEGQNSEGRTEQAVGSAGIDGLKGQQLANAVMIAHTRATRRMTLQFVGGGLLDESELNSTTTDINRSRTPLSAMATLSAAMQPTVSPNTQAGKDITPVQLAKAPEPFANGDITPERVETIQQVEQPFISISTAVAATDTDGTVESKRRRRRTKAEMQAARGEISLDSRDNNHDKVSQLVVDSDAINSIPTENSDKNVGMSANGDISESKRTATIVETVANQAESQSPIVALVEAAAAPINLDMPTDEETKAWKLKLNAYTERGTGLLAQGGMTENVFGRIRLYTVKLFPDAIVQSSGAIKLTKTQQAGLLANFESHIRAGGPQQLVKAIQESAK